MIDQNGRISIAKFPSARNDTWNVMAWEKVALDLAQAAGIRVPGSRLLRISGRSVLVVERFDRQAGQRVGFASAMTMLEASEGDVGSYLDIAATIEQLAPAVTGDLHELWRRIALSILISNTDDHLRNHAFLHASGGTWSLSPAFDLNPDPHPGPKHLSTAIDEYDTSARIETLMSVAGMFRLTESDARSMLGSVLEATERWRQVAAGLGLTAGEIGAMEPAFEHPETRAARALTQR